MQFKLFEGTNPYFSQKEFYSKQKTVDHLNQNIHRERLLETVDLVERHFSLDTQIIDLGAGNGGLIFELKNRGFKKLKGYDLQPDSIGKYDVDLEIADFREQDTKADLAILAETLEHMENPLEVLKNINTKSLIITCPWEETNTSYYEYHLWAWTENSLPDLACRAGWKLKEHYVYGISQYLLLDSF